MRRLMRTVGADFALPLFHSQVDNVEMIRNIASNRHHSWGRMALVHPGKLSSSPLLRFVFSHSVELGKDRL